MRVKRAMWAMTAVCAAVVAAAPARAETPYRVSAPMVHENLAVYLLHGASAGGPVPLTLQEAMAAGKLTVHETGDVNNLSVENTSDQTVFVQAGEIVKGGKQDRVLTVSLMLAPRSGRVPIAAYCVEHGRWTPRAGESAGKFDSSASALPSRAAKLALYAPPQAAAAAPPVPTAPDVSNVLGRGYPVAGIPRQAMDASRTAAASETSVRQRQVWDSVAEAQRKLSRNLSADVAAPQSATSLQLTMENKKLAEARASFAAKMASALDAAPDAVGYVIAINGRIASGDTYASHALFKKLWPKLLDAAATEAIAEKDGAKTDQPTPADVAGFLAASEAGGDQGTTSLGGATRTTRASEKSYLVDTRTSTGEALHRAYLAR